MNALKKDSEIIQAIDNDFTAIMSWFHVFFFSEAKPTDFKGTLRFVSPPEPYTTPEIPIACASKCATHDKICSQLCKHSNEMSSLRLSCV